MALRVQPISERETPEVRLADSANAKVISISSKRVACADCALRKNCLPNDLDGGALDAFSGIVIQRAPLKKGATLYNLGKPFKSLYVVRTGALKSISLMRDGRTQVVGFHLPGDLFGLDAISADRHPSASLVLETSHVCELPFSALADVARSFRGVQGRLLRAMSAQIRSSKQALMMLGLMNAEERLAACLLSLSQRYARQSIDGRQFTLAMSRAELGEYLGLALETVSRLFARLRNAGVIECEGRSIVLRDIGRLRAMLRRAA